VFTVRLFGTVTNRLSSPLDLLSLKACHSHNHFHSVHGSFEFFFVSSYIKNLPRGLRETFEWTCFLFIFLHRIRYASF